MTNGGTKIGLTLDDVRCLTVLLPPLEEQARLVAAIEYQTRELDVAISRLEREIELLREYRTRLVADVVTGKLDVREAATRLPEDVTPDTAEDAEDYIGEVESDAEDTAA
jgi:type I restriction enzyme S subunit